MSAPSPRAAGPQQSVWVAERVGPRIRARRMERGISLRELARRTDLSASFVSLVETGRCAPSLSSLRAISSELEISADALLSERRPV
jgi:transcriptional regulator with XRE-family HTH domain